MNVNSKTHTKDYLVEFSQNQKPWLKLLIIEALNTNGKVSESKSNEVYSCLKDDKDVQIPNLTFSSTSNNQNVVLKKLEHISGVNALASNQIIKFSYHITILYGLNGAGKSSYFKVLNELTGGNENKVILQNIHNDQPQNILVKLMYNDGKDHELVFDNSQRGFKALAGCKVFDSSYLNGLLSQRIQDETVLEPLGLHLFKYISDKIDWLKGQLKRDAEGLKTSKPSISYEKLSDQLRDEFEENNISEPSIKLLKRKFVLTDESAKQLEEKQAELVSLKQTNYVDRIAVLTTENTELKKAFKFLKKKKEFDAKAEGLKKLLTDKKVKEDANKQVLEKISVLKNLTTSESKEWKDFISAGATLKAKFQTDDKYCLYCNQPLQDQALNLVQAYADFLNDKSEGELQAAKNKLSIAKKDLEAMTVELELSDNFKQRYNQIYLENTEDLIISELDKAQRYIKNFKTFLLSIIDGKVVAEPENTINTELCLWLVNKSKKNFGELKSLRADNNQKNIKIITLEREIKELLENKSISDQKDEIVKWLNIDKEEKAIRKKESEISTNTITRLSNTAHDELLTLQLESVFKKELDFLGYANLEVNLIKARGGKGSNSTKLILKKNNSIHSILSEGEQKAVGLALFLAEATVQNSQSPIILDDPVNSLDHKIASNFTDRLMSLENQLIIFNHNRLFQDAFETTKHGHICNTIETDCNKQKKHILVYKVSSEGKSQKGVLSFHRTNTFRNHMNDAKYELNQSPFTEHVKVAGLVRKAVECIIDEYVLNGVIPTKYSNKNNRIHWGKLKELNCTSKEIEIIQKVYDRVSGGNLHNGTESENNHIEVEEFKQFLIDLEDVVGVDG